MQQSQHTLQYVRQHSARLVIPVAQAHFREFDVPVGEVAPDEIVQHALRLAELEVVDEGVDADGGLLRFGEYPAILPVLPGRRAVPACEVVAALHLARHETPDVP